MSFPYRRFPILPQSPSTLKTPIISSITATFTTYTSFHNRRSPSLWHRKLFPFQESAAMNWGVSNELTAIERYKLMTGNHVSAALGVPPDPKSPSPPPPQRSEEWFALRHDKLTTSAFSTALGFWNRDANRRSELWHQKVFPAKPEESNPAMDWGSANETLAIERYKVMTGNEVKFLGFAGSGWLGASPDGLVGGDTDGGILEVKCPYNGGRPEIGVPWKAAPYYYMPQVQGQMEIMDRDWVDLYCWLPGGSAVFRVVRDKEYWGMMEGMLRDFWWGSVVPAKKVAAEEGEGAAMWYEPEGAHELTAKMIARSRKMAEKARLVWRDEGGKVEFFQ